MTPNPDAPAAIIRGVSTIEALDSGGIVPAMPNRFGTGTVLVPLPAGCSDKSGLGYDPAALAFAVLYFFGDGKVIVIGHSGIAGDDDTHYPSRGQIGDADNLLFLMNCVTYLAGFA
jgi:hypothetical protein